ncbi:RL11 Family [Baboon cytomegalovirus]|nr:RL11 Family [Baboon cytomegalovirus]
MHATHNHQNLHTKFKYIYVIVSIFPLRLINMHSIYIPSITINKTVTVGSNVTLELPDNVTFMSHVYYVKPLQGGLCSHTLKRLCNVGQNMQKRDYRAQHQCMPTNYTCTNVHLRIYNILDYGPTTYLLMQQGNLNGTKRNTTYHIRVISSTPSPSHQKHLTTPLSVVPIVDKYTNTKHTTIIIPIVLGVIAITLMITGYLYYRIKRKNRFRKDHREPHYTTVK